MRRMFALFLLATLMAASTDSHAQLKSGSQRQQYRDAVKLENRTDYTGSQQLRDDRRDMLRDGVPLDQIQEQQLDQINSDRTAPQPDFSEDAEVRGTFNSPFMGVSSPRKKSDK